LARKFRRYDALLTWWWRHTELAAHEHPPFVLFICQDNTQRDDFLARADQELTGHRWHPTHTSDRYQYIGRRHILFCDERDAHLGHSHARRLPPYPPAHPARSGKNAEVRGVRLPVRATDLSTASLPSGPTPAVELRRPDSTAASPRAYGAPGLGSRQVDANLPRRGGGAPAASRSPR
jgi:hypothetical protein